ncbi:MAG: amidase [Elainella sp. Prado103]|jgi:amidase|nr:amidase [Elainella sp. Prado103]
MNSIDLAFTSVLEQAQLIRNGTLSPVDLVELYLSRIQNFDQQLGSYVTVMAEQALAEAKQKAESLVRRWASDPADLPPFWGVPIAIKDLTAVQNVRCTYGSPVMAEYMPPDDDAVVSRIRQAGFIILGKTSVSEFGSLPYTEPSQLPIARNPWNLNHTPGGSSGGSAAAVAAGLIPIAHGSDGGGSVRGPAFCCGVVGLKAARGRISFAPVGDHQSGIATHGVLARTIADAAALLDVMSGYVPGDPYWLPDPELPFVETAQRGLNRSLRIAYSTEIMPIGQADPSAAQAVMDVVAHLMELGHQLEPGCPDCTGLVDPFVVLWRAAVGTVEVPSNYLSPFNQWLLAQSDTSGDYLKAVWAVQQVARRIVRFFEQYDALVLPTYLHPAIRIGEWADLSPAETLQRIIAWIAPCPPFNASGQPAIHLPTGLSAGLPIGIQMVGRPADEATLLALAAQLETKIAWQQRPDWVSN